MSRTQLVVVGVSCCSVYNEPSPPSQAFHFVDGRLQSRSLHGTIFDFAGPTIEVFFWGVGEAFESTEEGKLHHPCSGMHFLNALSDLTLGHPKLSQGAIAAPQGPLSAGAEQPRAAAAVVVVVAGASLAGLLFRAAGAAAAGVVVVVVVAVDDFGGCSETEPSEVVAIVTATGDRCCCLYWNLTPSADKIVVFHGPIGLHAWCFWTGLISCNLAVRLRQSLEDKGLIDAVLSRFIAIPDLQFCRPLFPHFQPLSVCALGVVVVPHQVSQSARRQDPRLPVPVVVPTIPQHEEMTRTGVPVRPNLRAHR
mmetsp:Transcript_66390/g.144135  ORF Transcript_66390/g.144135 Transcript_66390/m.144135 type:complete len:308 (-) Transcript_66390:65-988(-)